jgi:predicted amidohydrolase YtcJ
MTRSRFVALTVAALALVVGIAFVVRGPQRVVYRGGPVLTMDGESRVVEALATEGERIVAVGSDADLRPFIEDGARVVDLQGRALLPGFIDAHGHFPGAGIYAVLVDLNSPPIGDVDDIEGLVARLAARAARSDPGDWVVGMGYDDTLLAERRHPTRADLDRASGDHPVAAWHISGHLASANGLALERLGIDRSTPDPEGGRIRRDAATGEPDGVLEESAVESLQAQLLQPSLLDSLRVVRRASEIYLAAGVTTAQNGYASTTHIRGLAWLSRLGLLPLRVVLWPSEEAAEALRDGSFAFAAPDPLWVRLGAVKLIADGSIQGYTGYLSRPYHVPPGDDRDYRGYPVIARDELIRRVGRHHGHGLQVAVHGNGDASIDDILDAFEAAQRAHPRDDTRHVVIHAQMTRDDQLAHLLLGRSAPRHLHGARTRRPHEPGPRCGRTQSALHDPRRRPGGSDGAAAPGVGGREPAIEEWRHDRAGAAHRRDAGIAGSHDRRGLSALRGGGQGLPGARKARRPRHPRTLAPGRPRWHRSPARARDRRRRAQRPSGRPVALAARWSRDRTRATLWVPAEGIAGRPPSEEAYRPGARPGSACCSTGCC